MPAVFVHGVPDTRSVWEPLFAQLSRKDVIALSLPGFGSPLPAGFKAAKEDYVQWLRAELARIEGPIDLVGHDWGSMLVVRTVSLEPDRVRSWVGGGAPIDPDYVWHENAKAWQTPKLGEQVMAQTTPDLLKRALEAQGQPAKLAEDAAASFNETTKSCILSLYRSAIHVGQDWVNDLARITAPGLILWGDKDPFAAAEFGQRLATRTRAQFQEIQKCGHWYQAQRPAETARCINDFWAQAAQ